MKPAIEPEPVKPPHPNDWGPRQFETVSDGHHYRLTLPALGIVFNLTRLRMYFGEVIGDLEVTCKMAGARTAVDDVLYTSAFKLSNAAARSAMGRAMQIRANAKDIDFEGLLHELAIRTDRAERQGKGAVDLATLPTGSTNDDTFDVYGIKLSKRHPTMLFGMGDSLKSFIEAVVLGELEHQGIRTLLIDWELDALDQAQRLRMLYGAKAPHVRHHRAERPLVQEIDRVRQIVHDEKIGFCALDSVGFGCAGDPSSAETSLAFMQAVRRLGVGTLLIAHQAKAAGADTYPFGSIFWFNACRRIYHTKRAAGGVDDRLVNVALYPTKANLGRRGLPVGLQFAFSDDGVDITTQDIAGMGDDLAGKLTVPQRLRSILQRGAITKDAIVAEFPDMKPDSVRRTLSRAIAERKLIEFPGPDGRALIGLHLEAR